MTAAERYPRPSLLVPASRQASIGRPLKIGTAMRVRPQIIVGNVCSRMVEHAIDLGYDLKDENASPTVRLVHIYQNVHQEEAVERIVALAQRCADPEDEECFGVLVVGCVAMSCIYVGLVSGLVPGSRALDTMANLESAEATETPTQAGFQNHTAVMCAITDEELWAMLQADGIARHSGDTKPIEAIDIDD